VPERRPTPCACCGAPTVEIGLFDGDSRLVMRSCSRCDHRTWSKAGNPARIDAVLATVGSSGTKKRSA